MKTTTVLLAAVMLMCCNVKSNSEAVSTRLAGGSRGGDYYESGMHYVVLGNPNFAVLANVTKDSIECAYYRKQLSK